MNFEPRCVDLHMHSVHSDGEHRPAELVPMALAARLSAIALTDHDTMDGLPELHEAARGTGLEVVNGVELSTSVGPRDIHILGYFVDPADPALSAALVRFRAGRRDRAVEMVRKLNELGLEITIEDVDLHVRGGAYGRPHVARALLDLGHVTSFDEAFRAYLGHYAPAFVPKPSLTPAEAIALIRNAGGAAVFAHPGTASRDDLIEDFKEMGLAGIEVWHPKHSPQKSLGYRRLARELGLAATGGSDFHGASVGTVAIGASDVPESALAELRARL